MKHLKLLAIVLVSIFALNCYGAEPATISCPTTTGNNPNFVLYPTFNVFTFLKLDTRSGQIWQVQYSIDGDEFETVLSDKVLSVNKTPGKYALYPTTNNWTFILLDTVEGKTYHVQWSKEVNNRFVIKIPHLNS